MATSDPRQHSAIDPTNIVPSVVAIGLAALLFRLWFLQIVRGDELSRRAEMRNEIRREIPAPRGLIVDRNGRPLASVTPRLAVMVTPDGIANDMNAIHTLASLMGDDAAALKKAIKDNSFRKQLPFVAKVGITVQQALAIEERKQFLPGVEVGTVTARTYPAGEACTHVIGYVGAVTPEDLARYESKQLKLPSFAGHSGIERKFDEFLIGTPGGETVMVDSRNRRIAPPTPWKGSPGDKLVLTIDLRLQKKATELLKGHKGAIVAMKPSTGEVLCLASGPTYDPNALIGPDRGKSFRDLSADANLPMFNRAISGAFGPGSTFKIVTLIAAIRNGIVTPSTTFVCNGRMKIGNTVFRCLGNHGRVDYEHALRDSCNIFFANLALKLSREQIMEVASELGFGEKTGVDLLGEQTGTLPWDSLIKKRKMNWYQGDNMNLSVGQGMVSVTPVQMAAYACLLANNGTLFKPHILLSRTPSVPSDALPQLVEPEVARSVNLDAEWWRRIHNAMVSVVDNGTGHLAQIPGIKIAGKTGSADWDAKQRSHAWFIGYAPADNPQIAFAIVVEAGGRGGREAAPLAKQLVEEYLKSG